MQYVKRIMLIFGGFIALQGMYVHTAAQEWFIAAGKGDQKLLDYLVEDGIDVGMTNEAGDTALHIAIQHDNLDIAKMLLNVGVSVDARGEHGNTPLHWAARRGNVDVVTELIASGANVNVQNEGGDTPLMKAIRYHKWDAVQSLLRAGADTNRENFAHQTPLSLLGNSVSPMAPFIFKDLLRAGARPPESGTDGWNHLPLDKKDLINGLRQRGNIARQAVENPSLPYPSSRDTTQVIGEFLGIPKQFLRE